MSRQTYDTDVCEKEWAVVAPLFPEAVPRKRGRPREHSFRELLNAIFYMVTAGCVWRLLPHDFPPWKTVYHYFRQWSNDGTLERIHTALREKVRQEAGREIQPSAGVLDSQSVKTTEVGGERGYDAGKQVNGRKRHILVDTMGMLVKVVVTAASTQDRDGAKTLLKQLAQHCSRLHLIWADGAYAGTLIEWVKEQYGWVVAIVKRPEGSKGFQVLPRRWVVERTFGWWNSCRRLSKDYEYLPEHSETFIYTAMIRLMMKRLART
jgi:putative transposase